MAGRLWEADEMYGRKNKCTDGDGPSGALLFGAGMLVGLLFPLFPLLFIAALLIIIAALARR